MLPMLWLGPPLTAMQYVVFPVLWMTSRFHIMEPIGHYQAQRYVSSSSPGGSNGGEVCRLQLHLVSLAAQIFFSGVPPGWIMHHVLLKRVFGLR